MLTAAANASHDDYFNELKAKARLEAGFFNIIDGKHISPTKTLAVIEPSTGEVIAHVADVDRATLDTAINSARNAFSSWSMVPDEKRRALLNEVLDCIERNYEEIAILLTRETGRARSMADFELRILIKGYRHALRHVKLQDEEYESEQMGRVTKRFVPIGVVCAISPWNFPVILSLNKVIDALVTGNTIVLKPSPFTPLAMLRIADLIRTILPPGVFNIITGGDDLGPWMTAHAGFDKVSFTGSTKTGKAVFAAGAQTLKHLTLELGGNDAGIVLADADVQQVAEPLFWSMFQANGQICMGLKRLFVPENLYGPLTDALVDVAKKARIGDVIDPAVGIGPSQNKPQLDRLLATWKDIEQSGIDVLYRSEIPSGTKGYFFPITLLGNPPADASFVINEVFGPIRPVLKYRDLDEAIRVANATQYGLGASVWGKDTDTLNRTARKLDAGTVWINQHSLLDPSVAYTGHKFSGVGVEFGREGLEQYTNIQVIAQRR
jgi:acyl-CoA reductase-like NAD-dependent aldehyde dehydrogenase